MMVPPFEAAVVAMDVDTVSDPVQTQFGWHVIRLNGTRNTAAPALEEVRGDLVASIERDLAESVVANLTSNAAIQTVPDIDPEIIMNPEIFND